MFLEQVLSSAPLRRTSFHIGTLSRCIDGIFGFLLGFLFIGTMILSPPFFGLEMIISFIWTGILTSTPSQHKYIIIIRQLCTCILGKIITIKRFSYDVESNIVSMCSAMQVDWIQYLVSSTNECTISPLLPYN